VRSFQNSAKEVRQWDKDVLEGVLENFGRLKVIRKQSQVRHLKPRPQSHCREMVIHAHSNHHNRPPASLSPPASASTPPPSFLPLLPRQPPPLRIPRLPRTRLPPRQKPVFGFIHPDLHARPLRRPANRPIRLHTRMPRPQHRPP